MTLSVGAATDRLVTLAEKAVGNVSVNGGPVEVVDGWPTDMKYGMFVVGAIRPPPEIEGETSGTRMWAQLGAGRVEEDYTIPCYIDIRLNGTQKEARDTALSIFDAFWVLFAEDLTLNGALKGGRWAEIDNLTFTPSNVGTAAEPGVRHVATFGVHCRSVST